MEALFMVTVRLPDILRKYAAGLEFVPVEASTVGEALRAVVIAHPDTGVRLFDDQGVLHGHLMVFRQGAEVLPAEILTTSVDAGDRIDLLVAVAGGVDDVRMRGFRERATVQEALVAAMKDVGPLASEAVRAEDTYGASPYNPVLLEISGQSMPGTGSPDPIGPGRGCRIMTGAPVPANADAVLRAEDADDDNGRLEVRAAVPQGRNVGRVGEDVEAGTTVLTKGRRLLPQDVGLLASVGHDPVNVYRRPM